MPPLSFDTESDAESLARCKGSDADMARLRLLAASLPGGTELWRHDDAEVVAALAAHHDAARLGGTAASGPPTLYRYSPLAAVAAAAAPASAAASGGGSSRVASAPSARATTAAEPASTLDQMAMAEALRRASQLGVPFCEECARAAA